MGPASPEHRPQRALRSASDLMLRFSRFGAGVPRTPTPRALRSASDLHAPFSRFGVGVPRTPTPRALRSASDLMLRFQDLGPASPEHRPHGHFDRLAISCSVFKIWGRRPPNTDPHGLPDGPETILQLRFLRSMGSASPEHRPPRASGWSGTILQHRFHAFLSGAGVPRTPTPRTTRDRHRNKRAIDVACFRMPQMTGGSARNSLSLRCALKIRRRHEADSNLEAGNPLHGSL
jgi:hypothetical protein